MRYQITGENRDTGSRESFTLEAESKAKAEKMARERGFNVRSVKDVTDGQSTTAVNYSRRGRKKSSRWPLLLGLVIGILIAAWWFGYLPG